MPLERIFHLAGLLVMPGWLLLLFAPAWRPAQLYSTLVVPLLLAAAYLALLLQGHPPAGAGFGSLHAVSVLFQAPAALLAGWLHYLALDLFTGAWEARDAASLGLSRWLVAPCLVLTFLFGPAGLALYLLLRFALRRRLGATL